MGDKVTAGGPGERRRLWTVFLVALTVIALEVVTFQALSFVNDYMTATRVLAVALMGIALGGLLSWPASFLDARKVDHAILLLLPLAVLSTFPVVIRLNPQPVLMMALMTAPYVLASLYISRAFNTLDPGRVYLYDLVGAGVGAVLVVALVPWLREEGSFFFLGLLAAVPLVLSRPLGPRWLLGGAPLTGGLALVLLVMHLVSDPFNMMYTATADPNGAGARKIFLMMDTASGNPRYDLVMSRGSLIERIDIIKRPDTKGKWMSVYNGRVVDAITSNKSRPGKLDNRMPTRLKLGEDPDTLLVGPSGQGLCKAIQALGDGHIDAVEINGAIARIMTGPMFKRSGRAYKGMDLTIGDVRTFMERTDRKYDFITLLNTHRIWSMGHQGPPEYVHTVEAMRAYLDHLKDDGFVLFEERNINERADLGMRRMVFTAKAAMAELGIEDPEEHFAIWELYHQCPASRWPDGCRRRLLFTFVMIKRTPIDAAEMDHLAEWGDVMLDRTKKATGEYRGIVWRYLPNRRTDHYWTQVVEADDVFDTPDTDPALHHLTVVTDDVPYPFDVFHERAEVWDMLRQTALLSLVMVLLPALATFLARRDRTEGSKAAAYIANGLLVPYFAMLGIGYLLIEVVLIQWFGIFLSSPVWSLVVVLATMLIASGLGGHVSRSVGRRGALLALGGVVALTAAYWLALHPILDALMVLPFLPRILAAVVLVAPLAFLMGVPFPYAMSLAKDQLSDRHAGLFFGINGALAAVATPLSIILGMTQGHALTLLVGGAAYLVCLALVAPLRAPRPA